MKNMLELYNKKSLLSSKNSSSQLNDTSSKKHSDYPSYEDYRNKIKAIKTKNNQTPSMLASNMKLTNDRINQYNADKQKKVSDKGSDLANKEQKRRNSMNFFKRMLFKPGDNKVKKNQIVEEVKTSNFDDSSDNLNVQFVVEEDMRESYKPKKLKT